MTILSQQPTGWREDAPAVRAFLAERRHAGNPCEFGSARPDLNGYWKSRVLSGCYAILPYEAERYLLGEYLPADYQRRGTCVGRGSYRAIQTTYWHALWERRASGRAERIAYEPIYAGGRVNIGRGVIRGDGLVGAWAAQYADEIGVVARGIYGGIDLTKDREDLATQWGEPGAGVPSEIIQASATHKCDIYHVQSAEQLADVTAAGFASAICSTHRQADQRDENGECAYAGPTAHCEAIVGVYMRPSWDGRPETIYYHTGFVDQQSWGNTPSGNDALRIYRGEAKLRQGAYGTRMQAIEKRISTGETWAFRLRDGFRSGSLSETVN